MNNKNKIALDIGYGYHSSVIENQDPLFRIGPWIHNESDDLDVNDLDVNFNIPVSLNITKKLYSDVMKITSEILNEFHGVNKSETYWKNLCGYSISAALPIIIILWYRIKEFDEKFNCCYQTYPPKWVPGQSTALDDLPLYNGILSQIANVIIKQRGLSIEFKSNKAIDIGDQKKLTPFGKSLSGNNKNSINESKLSKLKKLFKRGITLQIFYSRILAPFGMILMDFIGQNLINQDRVIISPIRPKLRTKFLIGIHTGYCFVRNKDLMNRYHINNYSTTKFIGWNIQRDKLSRIGENYSLGIKNKLQKTVISMIPLLIPAISLENWEKYSKVHYAILKKPPLACFRFTNAMERACYAEAGGKIVTHQHSFAYDLSLEVSASLSEKSISDYRLTWGKRLNPTDIPLTPTKLISFKDAYFSKVKSNEALLKKNVNNGIILWLPTSIVRPGLFNPADIFHTSEDQNVFVTKLFALLRKNSPKLSIRTKPNLHYYYSRFSENFEKRIKNYQINNISNSGESVAGSSIVVCDLIYGTIFLECIFVNHPVMMILRKWPTLLNDEANEVFLKLKDAGVVRLIEDSDDDILSKIFANPGEWWEKPLVREAINNFRCTYLPELPSEFQQWLNVVKTIKKYHAKA